MQIASAPGAYEPFAFDGSRLVVRRQLTGIDVLDTSGHTLSPGSSVRALGAELAGNDLVVIIPAELSDCDVASGNLLRRWQLPAAQSGGYCSHVFCGATDVVLAGAAPGLRCVHPRGRCAPFRPSHRYGPPHRRRARGAPRARGGHLRVHGRRAVARADPFIAARGFALALRDARFERGGDRLAHRLELDAVEHVLEEAAHDQALGFCAREPA